MAVFDWRPYRTGRGGTLGAIGVDFAESRVNWVQLERANDRTVRLRDAHSLAHGGDVESLLGSKTDLKNHVSQALRGRRFKGRRIVTHVPAADLRLMVLSYIIDPDLAEAQQVLALAQERMRDDLSAHIVDFVPIRTSGERQGERSALVAVTPEEPVLQHLDRLGAAGLEVDALEIAPVSIRRLVSTISRLQSPESRSAVSLVLRIGIDTTDLTLISGRRLLLYRQIEMGRISVIEDVTKGLDCDVHAAAELLSSFGVGISRAGGNPNSSEPSRSTEIANGGDITGTLREILRPALRGLVEQVHKAISYAAFQTRGMSIDKVYLLEGAIQCPGLEELLSEMLQLSVETFRPMRSVEGAEPLIEAGIDGQLAIALGFSMRGFVDV